MGFNLQRTDNLGLNQDQIWDKYLMTNIGILETLMQIRSIGVRNNTV